MAYAFTRVGGFRVRFAASLGQQPDPDYSTPEERSEFIQGTQRDVVSNELLIHVSEVRSGAEDWAFRLPEVRAVRRSP